MDDLEKLEESSMSEDSTPIESTETQPSQTITGLQYRKKLSDLKDWDRVMSRSKASYEAVQLDAIRQVEIFFHINA